MCENRTNMDTVTWHVPLSAILLKHTEQKTSTCYATRKLETKTENLALLKREGPNQPCVDVVVCQLIIMNLYIESVI